jgi:hypothetical protein
VTHQFLSVDDLERARRAKGDRGCSPRAAHGRLGPTYGAVAPASPVGHPQSPTTDRRGSVLLVNLKSRERRGLHERLAQAPLVLGEQ